MGEIIRWAGLDSTEQLPIRIPQPDGAVRAVGRVLPAVAGVRDAEDRAVVTDRRFADQCGGGHVDAEHTPVEIAGGHDGTVR